MLSLTRFACRLDAFCARLNAGLAAVAVMLALLTAAAWLSGHPGVLAPLSTPASDGPADELRF